MILSLVKKSKTLLQTALWGGGGSGGYWFPCLCLDALQEIGRAHLDIFQTTCDTVIHALVGRIP